jgi:D-3-phosphoglycerate dehydrogenase
VKVVVTDWDLGSREPARRVLERAGLSVTFAHGTEVAEVIAAAQDAECLMVRHAPLPREVFAQLPALRFVSRLGIGAWLVDLAAAGEAKVAVAHCPEYCTDEAVAHTMALVLYLNRRLSAAQAAANSGRWASYGDGRPVFATTDLTLGLIGLGRMGQGLANAARALGIDVIGCDPFVLAAPEGVDLVDLPALLAESDIVCLACPMTEASEPLINAETLALMKPSAYLVNTARGGLVDEAALIVALDTGRLAGAALDVLVEEPPAPDHPLLNRPDVLVTPHVAYYSDQAQHELKVYAARNVVHYLTGEPVAGLLTPDFRRV